MKESFVRIITILGLVLGIACSSAAAEENKALGWTVVDSAPPVAADSFDAKSSALRMVGGLFLCFGVFGGAIHIYKKYVMPRAISDKRRLQVVERLPLSPKSSLLLVKVDGKELLLSTGAESTRLIPLPGSAEDLFDETLVNAVDVVGEYNAQ